MSETARRVEVYRDAGGEWRWRRIAGNGEIVAASGEGYADRSGAVAAATRENQGLAIGFADVTVEDADGGQTAGE
jgi:uncharacterized protein YegP (UPF0339 family)